MKNGSFGLLCALVVAAALNPGCLCSGNGHVAQEPFRAYLGDDVVNCACNLSFRHDVCSGDCRAHFSIQICVPPAVRNAPILLPDGGLGDGGSGDGGVTADDVYAQRMDRYCRDVVTNDIYHLIQVWNGGWCEYKAPFAPQGGIGDSVSCFAQPIESGMQMATRSAPTCEQVCPAVPCSHETNCGEGVQDSTGNIHLELCQCSQVTVHQCPGDPKEWLPTPVFCRP